MFLITTGINAGYTIKGIVDVTKQAMLSSEDIDKFSLFNQLFDDAKKQIEVKAQDLGGDGVIGLKFNTEVVDFQGVPKFLLVHAYGTVVNIDK